MRRIGEDLKKLLLIMPDGLILALSLRTGCCELQPLKTPSEQRLRCDCCAIHHLDGFSTACCFTARDADIHSRRLEHLARMTQ